jgi:hypothetical protein
MPIMPERNASKFGTLRLLWARFKIAGSTLKSGGADQFVESGKEWCYGPEGREGVTLRGLGKEHNGRFREMGRNVEVHIQLPASNGAEKIQKFIRIQMLAVCPFCGARAQTK